MNKPNISTQKRTSNLNNGNFKPIIMLESLALIFASNALLSWFECTFSSPTHRNYLQYYAFTSRFKPQTAVLIAFIVTLIALLLHFSKWQIKDSYFAYLVLFYDILAVTYYVSGHFTATNKLSLGNLLVAVMLFALALCYYFSPQMQISAVTIAAVWIALVLVGAVASYILKVGWLAFILYTIILNLLSAMTYLAAPQQEAYIANQSRKQSLLGANLQAIFHWPWSVSLANKD